MELTKAKAKANQVKTAVIASLDAKYKTATVTVRRIKRGVRRDPKTVALGVLTGTVLAGVVTGVTAIAISVPNQPKTDFSEMAAATTTTAVTTYAPVVDNEVEEAVTTAKATTTTKTTTEAEAKEEVTTTKAVTTTAPVQEEPEVVTTSEPAVVIPDRSDDDMPIDFVRHEEENEAEVEETEVEEEESEAEYVAYDDLDASLNAILSSEDKYLLCNIVGHEYGSDYVPVSEKARIAAVIMNRVYNDETHHEFDSVNSVSEVLAQPGQFPVWLPKDQYIYQVTDSVKEAVLYYFNNSNDESYKYDYYYYGDGNWNYFRCYY